MNVEAVVFLSGHEDMHASKGQAKVLSWEMSEERGLKLKPFVRHPSF